MTVSEFTIKPPDFADYQKQFLYNPERFTVIEAGTKVGKTFSMLYWLFEYSHGYENQEKVLNVEEGDNFWWIAPVYSQAEIAFNRLWRFVSDTGLYSRNSSKLTITTPYGTVISFKTADKPDNLYGEDVYAAVFDEFTRAKIDSWYALRSTLTSTEGKCKFIGNYKGNSNWGHQLGLKAEIDDNYAHYRVTAYDAIEAGILSEEEVEQARKDLPAFMFKALYLAEGSVDTARLISDNKINDLLTNDFVSDGEMYLTADLAFQGSDIFVIFIWSGLRVIHYLVMEKSTGKDIEDNIKRLANDYNIGRSNIIYDSDGVGLFLEGYLSGAISFKNNAKALSECDKKVEYKNLKSQCQFKLSELINENKIYFECDIAEIKNLIWEELECYKNRNLDEDGKLETLRKKEIKQLIGRSPDYTDALMMRMYPVLKQPVNPNQVKILKKRNTYNDLFRN